MARAISCLARSSDAFVLPPLVLAIVRGREDDEDEEDEERNEGAVEDEVGGGEGLRDIARSGMIEVLSALI